MISLKELNPHNYDTTPEIDANLQALLLAINKVRELYGVPMAVTSGLRSEKDQARINPSAPKSKHLIGAAVDIEDRDGKLKEWINANMDVIIDAGLYLEDFGHTVGWVHMQIYPPKSGKRILIP